MKRLLLIILLICPMLCFAQVTTKSKYEIISKGKDNRGVINHLNIYISRIGDIKQVNKDLVSQYKQPGIKSLQILYFDNKPIAKTYEQKLFDKNTTDNEIERMSKHVIGKFEYLAIDNSQSLHIGKEANNY
ncbi:hypothetical protein [Mucilaginibacter lappiensis]|uniref:Uncharacterized protein n=1 Tax=Mucilaginibacter lappiensis TaxID=354630 RepID=A0A841JHK7_9SPHI|nr:hypothetical protein [Mucilaginibacter lappiensis]MBB6130400.1 hypothetical protein [Mucilaginibacter lappiensis]